MIHDPADSRSGRMRASIVSTDTLELCCDPRISASHLTSSRFALTAVSKDW